VAKAPIPDRRKIDGVNLIPYLTGVETGRPHDVLYWRLGPKTAVRVGDWKLLTNERRGVDAKWRLYNLADDLGETRDLAAAQPEKTRELARQWDLLNRQMIDPIWSPRR